MGFFSFSLLKDQFVYLSNKIEPNKKYFSKDITLWKELNNRNKNQNFCFLKHEKRSHISSIEKRLLLCLPPNFGLGDAVEYSIAINSLIKSNKFLDVGIAFCSKYEFIFKEIFLFKNIYPLLISEDQIRMYETIFHLTHEVKSLKFQKYKRSNIALEICKYFNVPLIDFKVSNHKQKEYDKKTISIYPISTSTIRSMPYSVLNRIVESLGEQYKIKVIIDDSDYSKYLIGKNDNKKISIIKPKNISSLIEEISKIWCGIFIDSGPLHVAKIFNKKGFFIETSVDSEILLSNYKNIFTIKNIYKSNYCDGPCGLVDLFFYNGSVGCYETNKLSFEKIKSFDNFKSLQRWNKKDINPKFYFNPVGCVKKIRIKEIIEMINNNIREN